MHRIRADVCWKGVKHLKRHKIDMELPIEARASFSNLAKRLLAKGYLTLCLHSNPHLGSKYFANIRRSFNFFKDISSEGSSQRVVALADGIVKILHGAPMKIIQRMSRFSSELYSRFYQLIYKPLYPSAEELFQEALWLVKWCRNTRVKRFFLWVHCMDTHEPYIPPADYLEGLGWNLREALREYWEIFFKLSYDPDEISHKDLKTLRMLYDLGVRYVDSRFKYFLEKLEEMGFLDGGTIVILTADHGELLGEHDAVGHGGLLYDELLSVPLIIYSPSLSLHMRIDRQVALMDLSSMILKLTEDDPSSLIRGKLISDGHRENAVISEYAGVGVRMFSYRSRGWKYILTIRHGSWSEELYNIASDPRESINLINEKADVASEFRARLLDHIKMEIRFNRFVSKSRALKRAINAVKLK